MLLYSICEVYRLGDCPRWRTDRLRTDYCFRVATAYVRGNVAMFNTIYVTRYPQVFPSSVGRDDATKVNKTRSGEGVARGRKYAWLTEKFGFEDDMAEGQTYHDLSVSGC